MVFFIKILISGGGTGGHVNPAISIANFIKARRSEVEIAFVGTEKGLESTLVPRAGYKLYTIDTAGLQRKLTLTNIKNINRFLKAQVECERILKEFKPDVVIGTGGYVSAPVVYKAQKMGIRTAIHEQNAFPGLSTKLLARKADKLFISFEDSRKYFKNGRDAVLVGNPVNEAMLFGNKRDCRTELGIDDTPLIVSFGGSLGSRPFNENMVNFIKLNCKEGKYRHIHATGKFGMRWMPDLVKAEGIELAKYPLMTLTEYIYNMDVVMNAADLIVSRAGAISLAETAVMGKPSILVPSPNVTNNHQYYNALAFENAGAAKMVLQKDCSGELLYKIATEILEDKQQLGEMGRAAERIAIFDSTQKIYDEIMKLFLIQN